MLFLVFGLLYAKRPCFPCFLLGLCVLYCLFGLGRATVKCLLLFLPVSGVFALFTLLFQRSGQQALWVAGRVLLMGLAALPMVTLPPVNLTRCLSQLGLPRSLTLGMLIAIRFVPVVGGEMGRVWEAMGLRGLRVSPYRAFILPVMARLLAMTDSLSLSLETRGFSLDDGPVSAYKKVSFQRRDACFAFLVAAFLLGWGVLA